MVIICWQAGGSRCMFYCSHFFITTKMIFCIIMQATAINNLLDGWFNNITAVIFIFMIILSLIWSGNLYQYLSFFSLSSTLSAVRLNWQSLKAFISSSVWASAPRLFFHSFNSSTAVSSRSVGCLLEMDSSLTSLTRSLRPSLRQFFPKFAAITSIALSSLAEGETYVKN